MMTPSNVTTKSTSGNPPTEPELQASLAADSISEPGEAAELGQEQIVAEEHALHDHVTAFLKTYRPIRAPKRGTEDLQMVDLRDQVGVSRTEDIPALIAQMQQVSAIANRRGKQSTAVVDPKNPYFGHLRLEETDRGIRDVLIGKATLIDPKNGIRIVDWRHAPVSQLYYRYQEGTQYEEEFGEREVEGEILVRRTVTIRDGELQRIAAPQGVYVARKKEDGTPHWQRLDPSSSTLSGGEGSAVRARHMTKHKKGVLGTDSGDQREDRHLPEIAALLDPHQFEVIASPDSGVVVVQGGAGSGKTTIGVHRMAYLAFQSQQRFAADRMLVVVGTPALQDYIGHLLGALDLGNVPVKTFGGLARGLRKRCYPWLKLPIEENTPAEVSRLKTDGGVLSLLERECRKMRRSGNNRVRDALNVWADVLSDRSALIKAVKSGSGEPRLNDLELERAWKWCSDHSPAVVEWTTDDNEHDDIVGADGAVERPDDRATLDVEDDALLLRAYQLVVGPVPTRNRRAVRIEHLFVDEAQDLAPVDFCVLADMVTEQKSITLAGDTAQRINLDTGFARWEDVFEHLGMDHVAVEPLKIAYRSTKQVLRIAQHVLGPLAPEDPPIAPRSGAPVEYHALPSPGAAAAFLADAIRPLFQKEPHATVALLTRYPEQADAYYNALKMAEVPYLHRVENYDFTFKPGVEVTDIRQVKGLEYDYVILADVNASSFPTTDEARYQLHIAATRAAHQLWVVTTGKPSPLLPDWLIG